MPKVINPSRRFLNPVQIQLSGYGGQGLILAGIILAQAAVRNRFFAIQTQVYGPEARGGSSRSEVIISHEEIDYPHVEQPDILLALSQEACDKYAKGLSPNSVLIVDSLFVQNVPPTPAKVLSFPIIQTAKQALGKEMVANILALGVLNSVGNVVKWDTLEKAVLERVPDASADLNLKALRTGRDMAMRYSSETLGLETVQ